MASNSSTSSSYQPLADFLASRKGDYWEASFSEVEAKLGRPLPQSAYRHQAWWANQNGRGHSQTVGWRSVGWRTSKLDLEKRRVTFEREAPCGSTAGGNGAKGESVESLLERAKAVSGIADRDTIIATALARFIRDEAARGLIAAGGTMPDLRAPPRRRPEW